MSDSETNFHHHDFANGGSILADLASEELLWNHGTAFGVSGHLRVRTGASADDWDDTEGCAGTEGRGSGARLGRSLGYGPIPIDTILVG